MLRETTAMNVRQNLGELLNEVQYKHDNFVITKAGKPVAALIDMALFKSLQQDDAAFEQLWARFSRTHDGLSDSEVMDEVTAVVKDVRQQLAQEKRAQTPAAS